jgi:peptide deformylase
LIVKDKNTLEQKCELVSSVEEGEEIGAQLLNELTTLKTGIGLAANQIGINKRVCVINVKEPIVLVNPEIVEKSEEVFMFLEGCLSFPKENVKTVRHNWVKVKADNHDGELYFSTEDWPGSTNEDKKLEASYECACVQHEIDHLDGITMFDRKYRQPPLKRVGPKIGRNDKVTISNGSETKTLKFKKAESLLSGGDWQIQSLSS